MSAWEQLRQHAGRSLDYAAGWKARTGRPVIGSFPMNFPGEIAHAAGVLPVIIQESVDPITLGHGLLFPFYCGYTRSITDQAAKGDLDVLDGVMFGDHCVQLLGAADAIRLELKNAKTSFFQLISSMCDPWTHGRARESFALLRSEVEALTGQPVPDAALRDSIRLFNRSRRQLRELYTLRRAGQINLSAAQMQVLVKSAMVMDRAEHIALVDALRPAILASGPADPGQIRLHLSGHFCQPPHPDLLALFEDCGAVIADDDVFHGYRYIATDVPETDDPLDGLAQWYLDRNTGVPCPTRVQNNIDWDGYLLNAVRAADARGVVVLMAKYCEPHMYYYPEIKEALEARGVPHLLLETEHEAMPLETMRTRIEAFLEIIRRNTPRVPAASTVLTA